jgi:hypothetical protein
MYEDENKTIEQVLVRPIFQFPLWLRRDWRKLFSKAGIIASGALLLFLIILLKAKTTADYSLGPLLFSYAIIVTTFELSRIISAMMYENALDSLAKVNGAGAEFFAAPKMDRHKKPGDRHERRGGGDKIFRR